MLKFLLFLDKKTGIFLKRITLANFVVLFFLLSAVVAVRFVPITSLGWSDEIIEWAFAWMVFMGAAALWRDNEHFRVDWLQNKLKGRPSGIWVGVAVELLSIFFIGVMTYYGFRLMTSAHDRSPILEFSKHYWYLCIPLAGIIMMVYSVRNLIRLFRKETGHGGKEIEISAKN